MGYLVNGLVALLSIGAFVLALYLAYLDRVAAASVCVVAAVLPALYNQLPFLEHLEILGLKAKLRDRVNEADAIIAKLKRIASVSAEQLFTQAALAGRWSGEALVPKQKRADQLTAMLLALDIPPAEIAAAKTIYLRAIAVDLAHVFFGVIRNLLGAKTKELARERDALFGKGPVDFRDPKGARWNELAAEVRRIGAHLEWPEGIFESTDVDDLRAFCSRFIDSTDVLSDDERSALAAIVEEIEDLVRSCRETGNYTSETIRYLEKYSPSAVYVDHQNLRFAEAFPDAAKSVR